MTRSRASLDPARLAAYRAAGLNERSRIARAMASAVASAVAAAALRLVVRPRRVSGSRPA